MERTQHPRVESAGEASPPGAWPATALVAGALSIVRALQAAGHEAYFVGGCVRNWLLGLAMKDVDIATAAAPEQLAALFDTSKSVGAHFGVVLVSEGGHTYEIATFRADGSYVDHRRPGEVRYGTLADDWRRRDFTVNAIYYDPVAARLVDPAGGREDLARRVLRPVGEPGRRFEEDALRLLRAVRFALAYGLAIEPATATAIRAHAATLRHVSAERVGDEMVRILTGPRPGDAMRLISELKLWAETIPEIEAMHGVEQPREFHPEGDVFIHTALVLDKLEWTGGPMPPELALAALLHDVGKPPTFTVEERIRFPEHDSLGAQMAERIGQRLRLSRHLIDAVVDLVAQHMRFIDAARMRPAKLRRFVTQDNFEMHLALHRADCLASHGGLESHEYCVAERERLARERPEQPLLPPPLVNGDDLIAMGLKPGPRFKVLLEAARDEQLEGRLTTREEALVWLRGRTEAPDA